MASRHCLCLLLVISRLALGEEVSYSPQSVSVFTPVATIKNVANDLTCSGHCMVKGVSSCNGFQYADDTKICTLGIVPDSATPGDINVSLIESPH